jgi:hypothetical protein
MKDFDWSKIKLVGDELSKTDDEAHLRSAFGRYYYAPYCSTKYYLINLGQTKYFGPAGSHINLINELQDSPDDNESDLGELLEKLFFQRVKADYLLERNGEIYDEEYFRNDLPTVKSQSNEALNLVSILKNNPPRHRFKYR